MYHKISKLLQTFILTLVIGLGIVVGSHLTSILIYAGGEGPGGVNTDPGTTTGGGTTQPNQNYYPNYVPIAPIVIDKTKIEPLSPSLNSDKTKNRINMLFYRSHPTVSVAELKTAIIKALKDTKPVNYYTGEYGVFDIEPFRSNMDKFNFWIYTESVPTTQDYNFRESVGNLPTISGLDFASPILLEKRPSLDLNSPFSARDNAKPPSITYIQDKVVTKYLPGSVTLYWDNNSDGLITNLNSVTLAHEMGHSIFNLNDEYSEPGISTPVLAYPSCASNENEGRLWWGNYLGQVDPFFYEYRDNYINGILNLQDSWLRYNGTQLEEQYSNIEDQINTSLKWRAITKDGILDPEEFRITAVNRGGCFADSSNKEAWRPNRNSIMGTSGTPIFGSYNRAVGQKILDLFNKPTPPTKPNYVGRYYSNIKNFQVDAISPATCQVVIQGDKKTLNCSFENQNTMMSDKIVISYGMKEFDPTQIGADDQYTINPKTVKMVDCKLVNGVSKLDCQGLDITNLDPNKQYILGLGHDATAEFGTIGEEYDGRIGAVNRAIKNYKTGFSDGEFKLLSLETIIIPEVKPIMTLVPTPVSTIITPVSTEVNTPIRTIQKTNPSLPAVTTLSKTGADLSIILGGVGFLSVSLALGILTILTKLRKNSNL